MGAAFLKAPTKPTYGCGKFPYASEHEANRTLKALKKLGKRYHARKEQASYKCRVCPAWHLTSQTHDGIWRPQKEAPPERGKGVEASGERASRSAGSVADGRKDA